MSDQLLIAGMSFPLAKSRYVIGRAEDCDVLLPADDMTASRRHALLEKDPNGRWRISDLGSQNGTFVANRQLSEPQELRDGDQLRIGYTVMTLELVKAPIPEPVTSPSAPVEHAVASPTAVHFEPPVPPAQTTVPVVSLDTIRLDNAVVSEVPPLPEPPRPKTMYRPQTATPTATPARSDLLAVGSTIGLVVSVFLPWINVRAGGLGGLTGSYVDGLRLLMRLGGELPRALSQQPNLALYFLPLLCIVLGIFGLFGDVRRRGVLHIVGGALGAITVVWLFSQFTRAGGIDLTQLLGSGVYLFGLASLGIGISGIRGQRSI